MRLWSLHPKYLDPQGLVALWREALLAQAVLLGRTKGYASHPQLQRFKDTADPAFAIGCYLSLVLGEATRRGYHFADDKILRPNTECRLKLSSGQLRFEAGHLLRKLSLRSPQYAALLPKRCSAHPMFLVRPGPVASWERLPRS